MPLKLNLNPDRSEHWVIVSHEGEDLLIRFEKENEKRIDVIFDGPKTFNIRRKGLDDQPS